MMPTRGFLPPEKRERLNQMWDDYQERLENGEIEEPMSEPDRLAHAADHDCKCQREYESEE